MKWLIRLTLVGLVGLGGGLMAVGLRWPDQTWQWQRGEYQVRNPSPSFEWDGVRPIDELDFPIAVDRWRAGVRRGRIEVSRLTHRDDAWRADWPSFALPAWSTASPGEPSGSAVVLRWDDQTHLGRSDEPAQTLVRLPALATGLVLIGLAGVIGLYAAVRRIVAYLTRIQLRSSTCLRCGRVMVDVDSDCCPHCGAERPLVTISS